MSHRIPAKCMVAMLLIVANTLAADAMANPLTSGQVLAYKDCLDRRGPSDLMKLWKSQSPLAFNIEDVVRLKNILSGCHR